MTDPRFRTVYKSVEDAPPPQADDFWIAVEVGDHWMQDYVSKGGKYEKVGPPYIPATLD